MNESPDRQAKREPAGTVIAGYPATAAGVAARAGEVIAVDEIRRPWRVAARRDERVQMQADPSPHRFLLCATAAHLGERVR